MRFYRLTLEQLTAEDEEAVRQKLPGRYQRAMQYRKEEPKKQCIGAGALLLRAFHTAEDAFGIADVSRISNEEKMGLRENDDLCLCWNIATGREEPTGFWKDGACRCTYGIRNYDPNIGRNN